ncbi:ATP-binding protein [Brunnivagina elsteri]|uniref:histidine kinase n=1 Tax=Brunnivagina elsteri CCALA 953 TaxID=987040 RepID=A0A2A2TFJ6_9CYAN|nr:ATP-binding protein [Calothrix elsteri]PAX52446.1 histidine kinase [Calothrix elsteri CCALA 953]
MQQNFVSEISKPFLPEGNKSDLGIESTLQELSLYIFEVETSCTGAEVAKIFEKNPLLPGVILQEEGKYVGMISRRQLLEFLIRPFGKEIFFDQPLSILHSYTRTGILTLPDTTSILAAMQLSLRRSPELLAEPIVVKTLPDTYSLLDVHELNIASWQIRGIETQVRYERSQAQIIQNDKMASLGRLVDGVAHEILDPVNFIWGNLTHLSNYSQDLMKLVTAYMREYPNASEEINTIKEDIEFDFLDQDLSKSLASIRTGAERLKKLVNSLQNFCHIDTIHPKPVDLHVCLDSIILLINSRIKGEIIIVKNYGYLPPIYCFLGQLNQVFMNLLSRAVDGLLDEAIRQQYNLDNLDTIAYDRKPQIEITTEVITQLSTTSYMGDSRWVSIRIQDNGVGMSEKQLQQITESFSIGKRAEKETSLEATYRIVTARHGGKLNVRSQLGKGTEFEILLPLV